MAIRQRLIALYWSCEIYISFFFVWWCLKSYSTIFQSYQDFSWVEPILCRGLSVLVKDTMQCWWDSNPWLLDLESSTLPLSHPASFSLFSYPYFSWLFWNEKIQFCTCTCIAGLGWGVILRYLLNYQVSLKLAILEKIFRANVIYLRSSLKFLTENS